MKRVCIIGHFGFGENMLNGQTIKTKMVTNELEKIFGIEQVIKIDTHGGGKAFLRVVIQMIYAFKQCSNIIIFPAQNGVKVLAPICNILNFVFHRKVHYIVIGGWLPSFLKHRQRLKKGIKKFKGVYVETSTMQNALEVLGVSNTYILKNFKNINALSNSELYSYNKKPYKICTFSRVMKEKGIEDIINAVIHINKQYNEVIYELDIYGQIDSGQVIWFEEICRNFPSYISYKGVVAFDKSVEVLKDYFMLVFPTKFYTEGIPGTIIDAYAAGLPVLAAKWESFSDVIDDGKTGIGYEFDDYLGLIEKMINIAKNPETVNDKRKNCLLKVKEFYSSNVMKVLIDQL